MGDFSFRLRVDVAPHVALNEDANIITLIDGAGGTHVELKGTSGEAISKSSRVALRSSGYATEAEAECAGQKYAVAFALALVRHRVGVELWARRGGGMFFNPGLKMLEEQTGERVLNDIAGLMTYETHPPPRFASVNAKATRGSSAEAFRANFSALAEAGTTLSESERIAIDLFNASFFEPAADTRLITLVMAVEALLDLQPRSGEAVSLVDAFVFAVRASRLADGEKDSLAGAATFLQKESISTAGRRLARERLGGKTYRQLPADKFFTKCYDIRSRLVHGGDSRLAMKDAVDFVAELEVFVSDLIVSPHMALAAT